MTYAALPNQLGCMKFTSIKHPASSHSLPTKTTSVLSHASMFTTRQEQSPFRWKTLDKKRLGSSDAMLTYLCYASSCKNPGSTRARAITNVTFDSGVSHVLSALTSNLISHLYVGTRLFATDVLINSLAHLTASSLARFAGPGQAFRPSREPQAVKKPKP